MIHQRISRNQLLYNMFFPADMLSGLLVSSSADRSSDTSEARFTCLSSLNAFCSVLPEYGFRLMCFCGANPLLCRYLEVNTRKQPPPASTTVALTVTSIAAEAGAVVMGGLRNSKHECTLSSQEYVHELRSGIAEEKLLNCLESLRVSLTSNPVSWVNNFGHEGLGLLLDALEKLLDKKQQESIDKKNQHKLIQCLKAFMNNKYGLQKILGDERSLLLLARAIDPKQPNMMTEIVKILSAVCIIGEENILDKILAAMTIAAERNNKERFAQIVEGLENHDAQQLQAACMQLINALVTSPDDLDFRIHLRNELLRCGLKKILPELKETEELDIQLKVFNENKEEDSIELSHRLDDIRGAVPKPGSDAAAQDALCCHGEDGGREMSFLQPSQEVETLLSILGCAAGVEGPGDVLR
ncbi:hypothetical protein P4O66_003887 [Electrophorus voltai]|uniref:GBD/FH3 domain-containing protein n=1 Tax=Electrophorus voltai TaxID=2609070 RepID=A0AAD8ZSR7_9TELE|nr:hypothetical protein P4O66_003887 [Electrophorus voltai]